MDSSTVDLVALREDPYSLARAAAEGGTKVVGVTPMHFPEELVHAAGALPILLQESREPVTDAYSHLFPHYCGFSRSSADAIIKGQIDFMTAVICSDMCVQTRWAHQVARRYLKSRFIYMWWPQEYEARKLMPSTLAKLERVKSELEETLETTITDEALRASIDLFNRHRAKLRELLQLRREKPGLFRARDVSLLVQTSMLMPKEDHIAILERVLAEKRELEAPSVEGAPRVFASGHLCHAVRPDILDLIEDAGAVVVDDDLYVGARYAAPVTRTDLPPMEALVQKYFDAPCPSRSGQPPNGDWADTILASCAQTGAQGVVSLVPRHCEAHMFYYPYVKQRLTEKGIGFALIEVEHEVISLEGTKTRIEAFVESLQPVAVAS